MTGAFEDLKEEPRWVTWRNEMRGGRLTKVPWSPVTAGKQAKADDPGTWGLRSEAEAQASLIVNGAGGGIGIELGDLGDYNISLGGIDLDSCRSEGGTGVVFEAWALEVIEKFASYTEVSPSGTGAKIFFRYRTADLPRIRRAMGSDHGRMFKRGNGKDHPPAIELHISNRYFAVTERRLDNTPDAIVVVDTEVLLWLINTAGPAFVGAGSSKGGKTDRSAAAYNKGRALRRTGATHEEMVAALRADPETASWCREKADTDGGRQYKRIWEKGASNHAKPQEDEEGEDFDAPAGVSLTDFYAYMPTHSYIYTPSREMWPAGSVNARMPPVSLGTLNEKGKPKTIPANLWLDQNRPVEQMTWAPGLPLLIADRLISEGGWIERNGVSCLNLYRPPIIKPGDAAQAGPWIDHVYKIFRDDGEHLIKWLAHRVQRPRDKINHALVLGGMQGIGKDTLLEPVKGAVGPWNFAEISPSQLLGRFNGFVKSVILRISEARDLGDVNRYQFYDHLKAYTAAPPDVLRVDEKFLREHSILNCCGVIVTTNYKTDGIYLPADDRRHFVAWSELSKDDFSDGYWRDLWSWYDRGGSEHVAAYLATLDSSGFNAKAPPPKTQAFWEIVDASRAPEDAELADVIDLMGNPNIVTVSRISQHATESFREWLIDRRNSRKIPHRFEDCGYVAVRNDAAADGLWKVGLKRQVIYAKASLPLHDRIAAAQSATGYR